MLFVFFVAIFRLKLEGDIPHLGFGNKYIHNQSLCVHCSFFFLTLLQASLVEYKRVLVAWVLDIIISYFSLKLNNPNQIN
jgi:hypothetical protein